MGNSGTVVRNTKKGFRMGQFHKKWCTTVLKFHAAASFAWAFNFPRSQDVEDVTKMCDFTLFQL